MWFGEAAGFLHIGSKSTQFQFKDQKPQSTHIHLISYNIKPTQKKKTWSLPLGVLKKQPMVEVLEEESLNIFFSMDSSPNLFIGITTSPLNDVVFRRVVSN